MSLGESSARWPWNSSVRWQGIYLELHLHSRCHWLSIQLYLYFPPYFSCFLSIYCIISSARESWILLRRTQWCFDCGRSGCFLEPFQAKFNHFRISLHPSFSKVFVEWTMFLDSYLHEVVDIGEVVEGQHSTLMARNIISNSPSSQTSVGYGDLINVCSIQMSHQMPDHSWQE